MDWPPRSDVGIAALLVACAVAEVVTGTVRGALPVTLGVAVASPAALAWRRSAPVAAALACAGGVALKTAFGLRLDGLALLAALLVAAYSVGRHTAPHRAAVAVAGILSLAWLSLFGLPPADQTLANYPFIALWVGGPAIAGAALRAQLERTATQAARAARAEMAREQYAAAAVIDERGRLARELHDTIAHAVSVMVLNVGAVRSRLPGFLVSESDALARAEDQGRRAIAELRQLLGILRTEGERETLEPLPTLAALDELVGQSRAVGLDVQLHVRGSPPSLSPGVEVSAYRIVQEALTNVRKHARARHVLVEIGYEEQMVSLLVADDGVGAGDGIGYGAGHGLIGIQERVDLHGGHLDVASPQSGGFRLRAELPVASL
ncbi:sensor histidine kinase [Nocardioides sp. YIM 152315]|uniref:sensor histidine kinase n=1 Tax=Nocardioides sp. YIM 152315 TaxID=3031760 RepID=UPI0023DC782D|nr:sensor histidine kinase [Nocardioides sp. YIM 152315]MDF1605430.1 sensor histidine kinase [Nocardioides sp. YIM 152315]